MIEKITKNCMGTLMKKPKLPKLYKRIKIKKLTEAQKVKLEGRF